MSDNKFNKRIIGSVVCTRDTEGKKTLVKFPAIGMFGTLIAGKKFEGDLNLAKGQQAVVFGDLAYEEYTTREGAKRQNLVVFVDQVKEPEAGKEPSVWVNLSLRTSREGHYAFTAKGMPWVGTRAMMGQGKDRDGNWKPSFFVDVKYFGKTEDDQLASDLSGKGVRFDAKGFLNTEEYETADGKKGSKLVLNVRSAEIQAAEPAGEPELEGEPA